MKRILIVGSILVGLVAVAVVGYPTWFASRATVMRPVVRATLRPPQGNHLELEVTTTGPELTVVITEISVDRALRDALGLGPPSGFKVEPVTLDEGEKDDKESAEFVATYNRDKVRYTGQLTVPPGSPRVLQFPAEHPTGGSGRILLRHETKIGMGSSTGFLLVIVGQAGTQ